MRPRVVDSIAERISDDKMTEVERLTQVSQEKTELLPVIPFVQITLAHIGDRHNIIAIIIDKFASELKTYIQIEDRKEDNEHDEYDRDRADITWI
jgi:hypothetical protein